MSTTNKERPHIKITRHAWEHLKEIVKRMKERGESGASMTRLVSEWALSLPIPGWQHPKVVSAQVDYCPKCEKVVPYHNGACHDCGTSLVHLTAIPTDELMRIMATLRVIKLRKSDPEDLVNRDPNDLTDPRD
jgi:hypothetical protein